MSPLNVETNAAEELTRAGACLDEAKILRAANFPYGAASRAYYAVFHAARALLFSIGIETKTLVEHLGLRNACGVLRPKPHQGTVGLLSEHFVKTGHLSPEMARLISRMQRDREDADYMTGAVFTDDEARELIADAERFLVHAKQVLQAG